MSNENWRIEIVFIFVKNGLNWSTVAIELSEFNFEENATCRKLSFNHVYEQVIYDLVRLKYSYLLVTRCLFWY